jgi:hypothetical protein
MTFAMKGCGKEQAVSIVVLAENGIQATIITA